MNNNPKSTDDFPVLTPDQIRGKTIELRIRQAKFKIAEVARKLGLSRSILYNYFHGTTPITKETILAIGNVIDFDFTIDFPELDLRAASLERMKSLSNDVFITKSLEDQLALCQREKEKLSIKVIELLEKINELLVEKYERDAK